MRPPPKNRIDTQPGQTPLAALAGAFAGLDPALSDLPVEAEREIAPAAALPATASPGRVVLRRERARRGGKTVIVIDEFAAHHGADALEMLAARLRAACGCGGTVRDRTIEVQGDQAARVRKALAAEGFAVAGVR
jgi:translation initiation factor 1